MLYTFLSQQRGREVTIFEPYTMCPIGVWVDNEFGDIPVGNSVLFFDNNQRQCATFNDALFEIAKHYKLRNLNSYYQDEILLNEHLIDRAMHLIIINSCKDVEDFFKNVSFSYHNVYAMSISPLLTRIAFKRLIDQDPDPENQYYDFIDRSSFNVSLYYSEHEIDL
ncbi:MAG: hypothetical protein RSC93_01765 [Erysipelotrichaceae bacterium]